MKKVVGSLGIAVLIFAALIFVFKDIDFAKVWVLLGSVDLRLFILAVLLFGSSFLLWNLRWQFSLRGLQKVGYFELLRYLFTGIFFNVITPGAGVGGEPVRAYLLSKKYDKPSSKFFGVILADKSFHLIAFVSFFIFSLIYIVFILNMPLAYKLFFGVILILITLALILFIFSIFNEFGMVRFIRWIYLIPFVRRRYKSRKKFDDALTEAFENMGGKFREVMKDKYQFVFGMACSFGFWIATFLVSYFLFKGLGAPVSFVFVVIAVSVGYFFGDLSPSPGGVGIMEAVMLLLYTTMGVNPEIALSVTLLDRIISLGYRVGLGGFATLSFNGRIKKFRKWEAKGD